MNKIWKGGERQPIDIGIGKIAEASGKITPEKGDILTGKKFYRSPLPSTYKEMELLEDLNDGLEWVFRDYGIYFRQVKDTLPPRDDVREFLVRNNTKYLENNLKLQRLPSDL